MVFLHASALMLALFVGQSPNVGDVDADFLNACHLALKGDENVRLIEVIEVEPLSICDVSLANDVPPPQPSEALPQPSEALPQTTEHLTSDQVCATFF